MKLGWCALALLLVLAFLPALPARAEEGATLVAIVTAEPNASLTRRVRAELEGLGVDVIVLRPPAEASAGTRAPLEQAARAVGAAAAVRLVASTEGRVEVWVTDRVTGKTVVRALDAAGAAGSDASVAVGTVELLRASLMELHAADAPRGEVPVTPRLEALAAPPVVTRTPRPPRLGLSMHGGAELGLRGLGPSADARLALWVRAWKGLGARVMGDVTVVPAHRETPSGDVALRAQWAGASLVYDLTDPTSTWVPELSLGIAAAHVTTSGDAHAPYVGVTASTWTATPLLGVGLAWAVTPGIRLRADALVGWALPGVVVSTPGGEAGRWGAPTLMLSPGVEFLWSP